MSARRYDWAALRDRYVTGNETLEDIANDEGTPTWDTLKRHSANEGWPEQRTQYRHQRATKTRDRASSSEAEVAARHARIARTIQGKALEALQHVDFERLTPYQILAYLRTGAQIERDALGMTTVRVEGEVDFRSLSIAQLQRIANGEDPARVSEDG